jgi:hypothetical protein
MVRLGARPASSSPASNACSAEVRPRPRASSGRRYDGGVVIRLLRIEDFLLAGWSAIGVPLVAASGAGELLEFGGELSLPAGLIQLGAVVAAIVAVATRPSVQPPLAPQPFERTQGALFGPLILAVTLVSASASDHLGLDIEGLVSGVGFVAIFGAFMLGNRLPVVDARLRRALVLPFVLVCAGIFDAFTADLLAGVNLIDLVRAAALEETGFGLFILTMVTAALGAFYAALVAAPRQLADADPDPGCVLWPIRFVLFLVSSAIGIGWLTALAM